jgi:hypothetical protein
MLYIYLKSIYLQISQETFNNLSPVTQAIPNIFLILRLYIYDKRSSWREFNKGKPKFHALFNAKISKALFNQESQHINYISLQMKYIHKKSFLSC